MIRKLRKKLIAVSMVSLCIVLFLYLWICRDPELSENGLGYGRRNGTVFSGTCPHTEQDF